MTANWVLPMIEIEALSRHFGSIRAVENLDFTVSAGEVLGVLGPNGAGKSTTMKLITGFLTPSAGRVTVFGHDIAREAAAAQATLGYLPEGAPIYPEMTPHALLSFVGRIRAMDAPRMRRRISAVIERLSLTEVARHSIGTLSKGYRRRVALAQAILHEPRALILDEPTDGLDPNQKHEVRNLIRELAVNRIVIVSTHILEEVEALCTRVIVLHRGRKLVDETPESLARRSRYHGAVTVRFGTAVPAARLEQLDNVAAAEATDDAGLGWTLVSDDPGALIAELRDGALPTDLEVAELYIERGRLDEVFRRLTTDADA